MIGRRVRSLKASARCRGARVTARPRATRARMASWSWVMETRLGVKPAARQARAMRASAGGAAGRGGEAVVGGGGPVVVAEVGEPDPGARSEPVVGGERDHEPLLQEV